MFAITTMKPTTKTTASAGRLLAGLR